jgi:tetratricopeptide (TPR) repeat protein
VHFDSFSSAESAKQALVARARGPGVEKSSNAKANNIIASCYRMRKDFTNAIKFSSAALELDPTSAQAAATKAQALVGVGEIELALKTLDASARASPKRRTPHVVKGNLLMIIGQYQQALDAFDQVLAIERATKPHPNQSMRGVILGHKTRIYLSMKRLDDAEKAANEAVSAAPTNPLVLADAARVKMLAQKYSESLSFIKASEAAWNQKHGVTPSTRSASASRSDLFMLKAACLSKLERYPEGLEAAQKATELDPNSSSALLMLGRLQERCNRLSDALVTFTKAQEKAEGTDVVACWSGLAAIYTKLGNSSKAQECMAKAAVAHPELREKLKSMIQMPPDQQGGRKPSNAGGSAAGDFTPVS